MTWSALSGRALGRKYADDPRGCQDFSIASFNQDRIVLVVCDGAGSARYSHFASAAIATAISNFFLNAEDSIFSLEEGELKKKILSVIARKTHALLQRHEAVKNDLLTTLLFVVYAPQVKRGWLGHVGDGMIIGATGDNLEILSHSEVGELHHLTYFTNDIFVDQSLLRIKSLDGYELSGVVCFSDGVEDVVYLKRRRFREYFKAAGLDPLHPDLYNLLSKVGSNSGLDLDELLKSDWIDSFRTDDDCSIALAVDPTEIGKLNLERVIEMYNQAIRSDGTKSQDERAAKQALETNVSDVLEPKTKELSYIASRANVVHITLPRAVSVALGVSAFLITIILFTMLTILRFT